MSANPIDDNATPKTTGSLEELFRHHLGEEAAVPPRPQLWDQIDNSQLIRQNEIYRKRLVATRWVAAASLLLATLAGTGWWAGHDAALTSTSGLATVSQPAGGSENTGAGTRPAAGRANAPLAATQPANSQPGDSSAVATVPSNTARTATRTTDGAGASIAATTVPATQFGPASAANRVATQPEFSPQAAGQRGMSSAARKPAVSGGTAGSMALATQNTTAGAAEAGTDSGGANMAASRETNTSNLTTNTTPVATIAIADAANGTAATSDALATTTSAVAATTTAPAKSAAATDDADGSNGAATALAAIDPLATHPAALPPARLAALPTGLAALTLDAPATADAHRWHYGASYSASVFNPNVDFSRDGIESKYGYNRAPGFGTQSPALTEAAAAQYRENLRPGLSQRIALLASRHLAGHWSLRTGAEFTQATAQSATSLAFVGEQLPDVGQSLTGPLQTTSFRYRLASVPVEVRYDNPVKHGWSLYGRFGGVVSALLGVRSDVEGNPEATRTYSIASAGTPYRRVLANVRGGAGAQFRPDAGKWAFTLGPVAEVGLVSMNAHPVRDYFAQHRPYSFGMEAAVEFGR